MLIRAILEGPLHVLLDPAQKLRSEMLAQYHALTERAHVAIHGRQLATLNSPAAHEDGSANLELLGNLAICHEEPPFCGRFAPGPVDAARDAHTPAHAGAQHDARAPAHAGAQHYIFATTL